MDTLRNNIEIWTPLNPTERIGDKQDSKPNNDSIEKYGLLTHIVRLDGDKKTNYKELLEKKLNELNKLNESLSLKVFADYHLRRGVIILIENDLINLHGLYKVTSTKHNLTKKTEEVEITIERYVEN